MSSYSNTTETSFTYLFISCFSPEFFMSSKKSKKKIKKSCCEKRSSGSARQGIIYGLIPHTGCIAFIVGSVLGVTFLMEAFRPLLMNRWFFHILMAISIGFATLSSAIYLRRHTLLSMDGIRAKWRYLSTMYGSTIGINLVLFLFIFPVLANVSSIPAAGAVTSAASGSSLVSMSVDIPCPGHAPLITEELKTVSGVQSVRFSFPNAFEVTYDPSVTSTDGMLSLEVFKEYPATVISDESVTEPTVQKTTPVAPKSYGGSCGGGGCGSGSCGGSCGCGG